MRDILVEALRMALSELSVENAEAREIQIEKPADEKFGDASTNVAMTLARELRKNPRQIAADIISNLSLGESVDKIDVAGAGFINFYFSKKYITGAVKEILTEGEDFGRSEVGKGKTAIVEYVSANPTGPLTVGRGRGGVLGDCIANMLEAQGYDVTREYYFNNAGRQMRILAGSVRFRYLELCGEQVDFPEDHYQGGYIGDIAQKIYDEKGTSLAGEEDLSFFKEFAEAEIFESIKNTLGRLGIKHDSFFNENTLYEKGENGKSRNDEVVERLAEKGYIKHEDGATWFLTTKFGLEKDKVLVKSTGEPSYRLPDIAYHITKFERDFSLMVNVFGADHIDEYPDVLRALEVLGYEKERVQVAINQFVTTTVNGEVVKMSTRKGNADLLDDLIDDVGADATRFFFIIRNKESHLNFDVDLAKKQSTDNPVFYLQYAHARICSLIRVAGEETDFEPSASEYDLLDALTANEELQLAKILLEYGTALEVCVNALEPQKLIGYMNRVAEAFHKFYQECRIVSEEESVRKSRLYLCLATRQVLQNGFKVLGISAPEKM
ncbi:arginyl-tRNA synthetase [Chloroherpeton thalassium ATCC 35110]|uniref:Arginine--tRNA ligase n=1 Tax=Chloroherpeton thalassium (strain ATCC 35110 / GB-78) TaxID=517418 RepID=B3QV37_CHLT3|nr:arginine--tRNA ligase [Chloroherpeton thalassium]ACF12991.1 arginyl-tRNA synthetase [Chloroherpeton thalassium ATCC 35110]